MNLRTHLSLKKRLGAVDEEMTVDLHLLDGMRDLKSLKTGTVLMKTSLE